MRRGCWFFFALLSGAVAIGSLFAGLIPAEEASTQSSGDGFALGCGLAILFGALCLYCLSVVGKIGKEQRKEKREQAMLTEMQMLRQQVSQQPQDSEEDQQIRMAGKLWKQGKKNAALEILESMPFNDKAQSILRRLKSQ